MLPFMKHKCKYPDAVEQGDLAQDVTHKLPIFELKHELLMIL